MQPLLSFEQAPPLAAPLRFFLTAPLFLLLCGGLLLVYGAEVFQSRWTPAALAATHLVTVGFMLTSMIGALMQVLPVVAGASLPRPLPLSLALHAGISGGALVLAAAFLSGVAWLYVTAAALLGSAVTLFFVVAGNTLFRVPTTSPTIAGLKCSLIGAVGVAALGVALALALGLEWSWPLIELTNLHAAWGFAAWGGVLLASVAFVVVPMFQLTPPYRARPSWALPPLWLAGTSLLAIAIAIEMAWMAGLAEFFIAALGAAFAIVTLRLQGQRRRARRDTPYLYWQWGMWSALAACAMAAFAAASPENTAWAGWAPLFGVLLGVGGFVSLIVGMLYRIVPFLVWLHLQQQGVVSNVARILPEEAMRRQMRMHWLAVVLAVIAVFEPEIMARPAGVALAASGLWLFVNLRRAAKSQ